MKVALELQPVCGKRSGIGTYTYELSKRLKNEDGLEFHGNLFNFLKRNNNDDALSGITMPINENPSLTYGVYRRIWHALPIPYKCVFPQHADLSVFFNYIVPPRINGRVVTTIHDMTYLRFPETMAQNNLQRIEKDIKYSAERSDYIITVSEFSKREIVELLCVPKDRVAVIPCAPTVSCECADFNELSEKFHISTPFVLYVGTIEPRKNLVRLIRAFDSLKRKYGIPHQLVLAGGKGWAYEEIYETAAKVAACQDIRFTGYVSQSEKNTLYQNASAFVFPSLYEGFGIPPLEAMQFRCPVVCADAASLPEVVGDAAQMVDPLDEESIAEGIWRVISDEEYAASLIQKGEIRKELFNWDDSARRLTELCKSVLGEI